MRRTAWRSGRGNLLTGAVHLLDFLFRSTHKNSQKVLRSGSLPTPHPRLKICCDKFWAAPRDFQKYNRSAPYFLGRAPLLRSRNKKQAVLTACFFIARAMGIEPTTSAVTVPRSKPAELRPQYPKTLDHNCFINQNSYARNFMNFSNTTFLRGR